MFLSQQLPCRNPLHQTPKHCAVRSLDRFRCAGLLNTSSLILSCAECISPYIISLIFGYIRNPRIVHLVDTPPSVFHRHVSSFGAGLSREGWQGRDTGVVFAKLLGRTLSILMPFPLRFHRIPCFLLGLGFLRGFPPSVKDYSWQGGDDEGGPGPFNSSDGPRHLLPAPRLLS
jgi:hypothetical protein